MLAEQWNNKQVSEMFLSLRLTHLVQLVCLLGCVSTEPQSCVAYCTTPVERFKPDNKKGGIMEAVKPGNKRSKVKRILKS